jgi:hypothetical protein
MAANILFVGTTSVYSTLSSYEKWTVDLLTDQGWTVTHVAYGDTEVTSGYDAVVVHARGAHGLGTKYRNCGMPVLGTGRGDLVTTGGGWGHCTSMAAVTGATDYYYNNDSLATWTGQTVSTNVAINSIANTQLKATSLDADAVIMCYSKDSGGNPAVWIFEAGDVVGGQTLTAPVAFLGLDSIYWQGGVANAAGDQLFVDLVDWLANQSAGGGDATATPAVVTATGSVLAPTITTTATITSSVVTGTGSVLTPTPSVTITITPSVVTGVGSVLGPTITANSKYANYKTYLTFLKAYANMMIVTA